MLYQLSYISMKNESVLKHDSGFCERREKMKKNQFNDMIQVMVLFI